MALGNEWGTKADDLLTFLCFAYEYGVWFDGDLKKYYLFLTDFPDGRGLGYII